MARLRVHPRKRAVDRPEDRVPHLSLEDFKKPPPPGWTGRQFTVDELPDEQPAEPGEEAPR